MHVKELTEERERLKLDLTEENEQLKRQIDVLERQIAAAKIRREKSDSSDITEGKKEGTAIKHSANFNKNSSITVKNRLIQ